MTHNIDETGLGTFKGPSEIEFGEADDQKNWEFYVGIATSSKASFTRYIKNSTTSLEEQVKADQSLAIKHALRFSITLYVADSDKKLEKLKCHCNKLA